MLDMLFVFLFIRFIIKKSNSSWKTISSILWSKTMFSFGTDDGFRHTNQNKR